MVFLPLVYVSVQWGGSASASIRAQSSSEHIPLQNGTYVVDDLPFTLTELEFVCNCIKLNKTPGHDGVPEELFRWLDSNQNDLVLRAASKCLEGREIPEQILKAIVVPIYKTNDSTSFANYRPISLLTSCYILVAALVGKSKNTNQAIYVARRLQDFAERSNCSTTLVLLDWEKAFASDKIFQHKRMEMLKRLQVPEDMGDLKVPQFKVSMNGA